MSEQILHQILNEIKGLNARFGTVEGDVSSLKMDMGQLKADVADLKSDVAVLKTDVADLKTDVGNLQVGQAELLQLITALKYGQEMTHTKLDVLTLDVRRLEGHFIRLQNNREKESTRLRGDIRLLNHRIADVELEVERLKNR
ncbi:hypothetical protein [Cohnella soli]|uniref:Uncharacterized protein n=1 Tax=Cohnella soli TaxID=425005 RepID=A0ABW0HVA1_9BACL